MKFDKDTHTYTRQGNDYVSVSTLVARYFSPFNAKDIARKLAKFPHNKANKRGVRYWLKLWKEQQEYGTKVHAELNDYLTVRTPVTCPEAGHAVDWLSQYMRKLDEPVVYPEYILFNDEYRIAGTSDCLLFCNGTTVSLIDWKVVKKITLQNEYDKVDSVLGVPDSNFWKYSLQLNLYAWMLRQHGYQTTELVLVQLMPGGVKHFKVPGMLDQLKVILEDRKNDILPNKST